MSRLKKAVKESKLKRKNIEDKFGFVPSSILNLSRGKLSGKMFKYQNEVPSRNRGAAKMMQGKETEERKKMGIVGGILCPQQNAINATIMPAELVDFFVKYYSRPGDVYLDPFMGQGIQMQVAKMRGLHYYGYDISTEFFKYIESVKSKIDDEKTDIKIYNGDSRYPLLIPDNIGDFSFHSPPYWDIEFYGEEPEQLGYNQSYQVFLGGMDKFFRAWLPKFKKGAYHVVNINDFRRNGEFYSYHSDIIEVAKKAGWKIHDTWIINGLVGGMAKMFSTSFNLKRIAPKVHEYAIVFKKP